MTADIEDQRERRQGSSALAMLIIGLILSGMIAFVFLHPGLRHWVSKEGESLQTIDILTSILLVLGTYFIHPVWILFAKWYENRTRNNESKPRHARVLAVTGNLIGWLNRRRWKIILVVLLVALVSYITIGVVIATTPVFMITSPRNGTTVVTAFLGITVEGRGAKPGESVNVFVFDGHQEYPHEGGATIDESGNWSVDNVVFQTEDFEYVIWAEVERDGVTVRTANRPRVTRSSSSSAFIAIAIGMAVAAVFVLGISTWLLLSSKRNSSEGR